ncbi:hypothetical protein SteCoe_30667 [Stentor coeruleus]|uniref:Uncharacterized protein n=1 Tax=Stentor coeruleus TaxID=5963 RepID=A0A1R2B3J6_9CILI|nr:hypothetical protein SteCoe_30667 [Stentor coeruleus]
MNSSPPPSDQAIPIIKKLPLPPNFKSLSRANRKTQFTLGTDKPPFSTEFSQNYKLPSVPSAQTDNQNCREVKQHHFILGSHSSPYETTASKSFEKPTTQETVRISHTPIENIYFGDNRSKKITIVRSDFTQKTPDNLSSQTKQIKELHQNRHFNFGSFTSNYSPTSKDYRAHTTVPVSYNHKDQQDNVILGNFKIKNQTEKQDKFCSKPRYVAVSQKDNIALPSSKDHVLLGSEKEIPLATSADSYRGEQVREFNDLHPAALKGNNVFFGNSQTKWESSYKQNFDEKNSRPISQIKLSGNSNFQLGFHDGALKSLAQESYAKAQSLSPINRPCHRENQVYLGGYKQSFETAYSGYGKNHENPIINDQFKREKAIFKTPPKLENNKKANFSFGNDARTFVSNFQKDFSAPEITQKTTLVNHNKDTSIVFGQSKANWTSTYTKSHS